MKAGVSLGVAVGMFFILSLAVPRANACSCSWQGPFLTVSKEAPLIVRGKITRHHTGPSPAMGVLVLETLKGALLDSGLIVQMGDGMHCRPTIDGFPPGTEWILALNGPGAKPGNDLALSHCGEFWLAVQNGEVVGSIDGKQGDIRRMPLGTFRDKLRYPSFQEQFSGRIDRGKTYRRPFGSMFYFVLEPIPTGWEIQIREIGREENLARLTPPLHGAPNPREIEGWHFMADPSSCADRAYLADSGPDNPRSFIFSPEVGRNIAGEKASRSVTTEDIQAVERFGIGTLTIDRSTLGPIHPNGCPDIERLEFTVQVKGGY